MNEILNVLLLLAVPLLPLMLAFPALRSLLPKAQFVALLPAVIIVVTPATFSAELPWLLFGTVLGIDGMSRLLLGISVLIWIAAAMVFSGNRRVAENQTVDIPSFFWLTMAGNFGAILATDLVGFFAFSTLMGYSFYALLVSATGDGLPNETRPDNARQAGRIYLVAMIVADLLLFEVLLVTALVTENMNFAVVHRSIAESDSLGLYLWLVVSGFALKAGIWPLHFWLLGVFRRAGSAVALLLCGVPVMIALLGMMRWLPLGEISSSEAGLIVQGFGVVGVLYAVFLILFGRMKRMPLKMMTVTTLLLMSGLFIIGIGTGLADAATWNRYGNGLYYFIALLGLGLVILLGATVRGQTRHNYPATAVQQADMWFVRWSVTAVSWGRNLGFHTLPSWRSGWQAKARHLWLPIRSWQRVLAVNERSLRVWSLAITLLLMLAAGITFIAMVASGSI